MMVDYLFDVRGDCVHLDYPYMLHSALKQRLPGLINGSDVRPAGFEGACFRYRRLLVFDGEVRLRIRSTVETMPEMMRLCGISLLVGMHLVELGRMTIEQLMPASDLWCYALFARTATVAGRQRTAITGQALREYLMSRIDGAGCSDSIRLGREVRIRLGTGYWRGHAAEVTGLTSRESFSLQHERFSRSRMGGGVFVPGRMPKYAQEVRRNGRRHTVRRTRRPHMGPVRDA